VRWAFLDVNGIVQAVFDEEPKVIPDGIVAQLVPTCAGPGWTYSNGSWMPGQAPNITDPNITDGGL
jgi:hypothetical protein